MNIISEQIEKNEGHTYFGGKDGFDYICFNNKGKVECSGKLENMLEVAERFNWSVAILIPVKFSNINK